MVRRAIAARLRPGLRAWVLVVCALLVFGTAFAVSESVSGHLADAAIHVAARTTQSLIDGSVGSTVADALGGRPGAPDASQIDAQLSELVAGGQLLRIKVWSPNGTILYSDLASLRGRQFPVDEDLTDVLGGAIATSISGTDDPENVFERGLAERLLSVYLPIRGPDGRVLAAFETYQDAAPIEADIATTRQDVLVIVGGLALALLVLLYAAFSGASRRMASQNRQLRERARVEQSLVDDLRRSDERFQSLVRNSADVQAIVGVDGRLVYESPAVGRVLGVSGRAGRALVDDIQPEDAEAVRTGMERLAASPGAEATFEYRARHGDGSWRTIEAVAKNLLEDPAVAGLVLNYRDVTDERRLEAELRRQAFHDSLTGLANRALFAERLEHALTRAGRGAGHCAVLFVDLDDFKTVNDGLGHAEGDRLLVEVARRAATAIRPSDTLARMGGDEFAVLVEDVEDVATPVEVGRRILERLQKPFRMTGKDVFVRASIGVAISSPGGPGAGALLRSADAAMYDAKSRGKHRIEVFEPRMHDAALRRLALKGDLERAIERDELAVAYQPIVDLEHLEPVGAEALVRWHHPSRGLVMPGEFIPIAEETGLIVPIGRWVLEQACREAAGWNAGRPTSVSANVSGRQLVEDGLAGEVEGIFASTSLPPERLVLEFTESVLISDAEPVAATLRALKGLGARLAIDDFGTGFSSLSYLSRLPIDVLKIDRAFVAGISERPGQRAVTVAILRLAETLGLGTVAEGIETVEDLAELRALGVTRGQGHLFAPALDAAAFEAALGAPLSIGSRLPEAAGRRRRAA